MTTEHRIIALALLLGGLTLGTSISRADVIVVREGMGGGAHPRRAEIESKLAEDEARIENGVQSGELTAREQIQLRREAHRIRVDEEEMVRANRGFLTAGQEAGLDARLADLSGRIFRKKHNEVTR